MSGPSSDCFGVYCQAAREIPRGLPVLSPVLATMAEGPLFNYEAQKVDNLLKLKRGELSNDAATWLKYPACWCKIIPIGPERSVPHEILRSLCTGGRHARI